MQKRSLVRRQGAGPFGGNFRAQAVELLEGQRVQAVALDRIEIRGGGAHDDGALAERRVLDPLLELSAVGACVEPSQVEVRRAVAAQMCPVRDLSAEAAGASPQRVQRREQHEHPRLEDRKSVVKGNT